MDDRPARQRLSRVLAAVGMTGEGEVMRLESYSADVWKVGEHVVRIGWRGDIGRYTREAALAASLPAELKHPEVVDVGGDVDVAWTVTRYVKGRRLDQQWDTLDLEDQRRAVAQVGLILCHLHSWKPPEPVAAMLREHAVDTAATSPAIVGMDICPLPVDRAIALAEHARSLPYVDDSFVDKAIGRLEQLARHDPYRGCLPDSVVHGDLHFANLLWNDGDVVAVLDLEWVRLGSPDQDLEPLLRSVDWARSGDRELVAVRDMTQILGWLAAEYPALFAAADLVDRLWLYQLVFTVRELFTWTTAGPPEQQAPDHPLNQLPRFLTNPAHIRSVLARAIDT